MYGPAIDSVMGSVPRAQAGVASGTNSTGRQVGTALGVAVIGSLLVSGYRAALAGHTKGLTPSQLTEARASVGSALAVAHEIGGHAGRALADAARAAFVDGMRLGLLIGAGLLVVATVLAARYLPAKPRDALDADERAELTALEAPLVID
jgi:hypothetical protein